MKRKLIIAAVAILCFSYSRSSNLPDSTWYIENNQARMPVVVRGNVQSKDLIIFLHGGPGGTSMKKIGAKAFLLLEKQFKVVYWDQRGSLFTKGGDDKKFLTLDQYVDDLDKVVDQIRERFAGARIFLMGHCWGGALGTAYLSDSVRHEKISGWIDVAGAHNNPRGDSLSMEWVKAKAREKIALQEDAQYWQRALRWYDRHPDFSSADLTHYVYVKKMNGYVLQESDDNGLYPGYHAADLVTSPIEFARYHLNYQKVLNRFVISEIDLSDNLTRITVPTLIIWGEEDGLVPVAIGFEAYYSMGTPADKKKLVLLQGTAHTSFYEQPERFANEVCQFIHRSAI